MVESILAGLFVSGVGALMYLAYQHPQTYNKISSDLYLFVCLCFACAFAWSMGKEVALFSLLPFLEDGKSVEAREAIDAIGPSFWLSSALAAGSYLYLKFLDRFVSKLKNEREEGEQDSAEP